MMQRTFKCFEKTVVSKNLNWFKSDFQLPICGRLFSNGCFAQHGINRWVSHYHSRFMLRGLLSSDTFSASVIARSSSDLGDSDIRWNSRRSVRRLRKRGGLYASRIIRFTPALADNLVTDRKLTHSDKDHQPVREKEEARAEDGRSVGMRDTPEFSTGKAGAREVDGDDGIIAENLSLWQKFKQMYRDYWYVLIPVHVATSSVWLTSFYYLAAAGVDVHALLEHFPYFEVPASAGNLAIAYAMYKIATPARYFVTVSGTTVSIHYLVQWGLIKPVPSRATMKHIYKQKSSEVRKKLDERSAEVRKKLDEHSSEVRKKLDERSAAMKQKIGHYGSGARSRIRSYGAGARARLKKRVHGMKNRYDKRFKRRD